MPFDFSTLDAPIIAAPMAGGPSTPELVAAVNAASGLGFLAAGYLSPDDLASTIARTRKLTDAPFGVNVFARPRSTDTRPDDDIAEYAQRLMPLATKYGVEPGAPRFDDDNFHAKLNLLIADPVQVVTFTFGPVAPDVVRRLREAGTTVGFTVTSADEARRAEDLGADFVVAQGSSAGGHRGVWSTSEEPNTSSTKMVVASTRAVSDMPVIAAGGISTAEQARELLADGCVAVAVGTLFVPTDESGVSDAQKDAYTSGAFGGTTVTRAFSGRYARGLTNEFIRDLGDSAPSAYPEIHHVTSPIRRAAAAAGDTSAMALWAGEAFAAAVRRPAADVVRELVQ